MKNVPKTLQTFWRILGIIIYRPLRFLSHFTTVPPSRRQEASNIYHPPRVAVPLRHIFKPHCSMSLPRPPSTVVLMIRHRGPIIPPHLHRLPFPQSILRLCSIPHLLPPSTVVLMIRHQGLVVLLCYHRTPSVQSVFNFRPYQTLHSTTHSLIHPHLHPLILVYDSRIITSLIDNAFLSELSPRSSRITHLFVLTHGHAMPTCIGYGYLLIYL